MIQDLFKSIFVDIKMSENEITQLARQFTDLIPGHEFTIAALQGYLLQHKNEPEKAVHGAAEWVRTRELENITWSMEGNNH